MLDRTKTMPLARLNEVDEQFADSKSHKLAMTLHALQSSTSALYEMSMDPEYRDLMVDEAGSVSEIALAISLVWSRVQARSAA